VAGPPPTPFSFCPPACRTKRGRNKNFSARAGKKEGGWGEGIPACRQAGLPALAFRRRRISYFALQNAPPRILLDDFHKFW